MKVSILATYSTLALLQKGKISSYIEINTKRFLLGPKNLPLATNLWCKTDFVKTDL